MIIKFIAIAIIMKMISASDVNNQVVARKNSVLERSINLFTEVCGYLDSLDLKSLALTSSSCLKLLQSSEALKLRFLNTFRATEYDENSEKIPEFFVPSPYDFFWFSRSTPEEVNRGGFLRLLQDAHDSGIPLKSCSKMLFLTAKKAVEEASKVSAYGLNLESLTYNLMSSPESASFIFHLIKNDKSYRKALFNFINESDRISPKLMSNFISSLDEEKVIQLLRCDKEENRSKVLRKQFQVIFDHFPSVLLNAISHHELFKNALEEVIFYYKNSLTPEEHDDFLNAKKQLVLKFNPEPENPLFLVVDYLHGSQTFDRESEFEGKLVKLLIKAAFIKQDKEFYLKMLKILDNDGSSYPESLNTALLEGFTSFEEIYSTSPRILGEFVSLKMSTLLPTSKECQDLLRILFENYELSKRFHPTIGLREAIEAKDLSILKPNYLSVNTILDYFALILGGDAIPNEKVVENAAVYLEQMKLVVPEDGLGYQIELFFSKLSLKSITAILSKVSLIDYKFNFPQFSTKELVDLVRHQHMVNILWPFRDRLTDQLAMPSVRLLLENYQEAYNYVTFMDPSVIENAVVVNASRPKHWFTAANDALVLDSILARGYRR